MIKAIIFDCFGVLLTDALEAYIVQLGAKGEGLRNQVNTAVDNANRGIVPRDASRRELASILSLSPDEYAEVIRSGEKRNDELFTYILELRKSYKTALLSNVSEESLQKRFTSAELEHYFDMQFISGSLGIAKPDREIYEHALRELDVDANEVVFIDDRQNYLDPAANLGIHTILYKNFEQFKQDLQLILTN